MAIESSTSTASPLALRRPDDEPEMFDVLDEPDREEEQDERTPARKPRAGSLEAALLQQVDDVNLARYLDAQQLDEIGIQCVREYEIDEESRNDWCQKADRAMKFATQDTTPKETPWPGASNMIYPLISQSALEFGARTYPAVVQGRNVFRGVVWGSDRGTPATEDGDPDGQPKMITGPDGQPQPVWLIPPGAKRKLADKIGEHMSFQVLNEMPEWEPQTDQYLHQMAVIGGFIRKSYFDPVEKRNTSLAVSLQNLVWNYRAPSFEAAPRHTEKILLYPHEIVEMERAGVEEDDGEGMFLKLEYGPGGATGDGETFNGEPLASDDQEDDSAPHLFLEQHRRLDLDDDGYPEPYVVTVHRRSQKVVRISARYAADGIDASDDGEVINRIRPEDHYTLYPFLPNLEGGSYPMGFGHLLRPINSAINTTLNQMFDAGTLANAGGGFISDQLGVPSGQTLFQVGKFVRVTTKGMAIREAVYPLDFKGANPVLFQLLGLIVNAGEKLAGIGQILAGDAAIANAPPTTVVALIEQGLKLYTAIVKRVYRALGAEAQKLHRLNQRHITAEVEYKAGDEWMKIGPEDYRMSGGVEPVADPSMTTDMQKLARAQLIMSTGENPLISQKEVLTRFFEAANIDRIDDLFAPPNPQAQQLAAQAAQMAIAMQQAQLGAERAKELRDQTQAFLNMALARKNANAGEEAQIDAQLEFMRLRIEAINSAIKSTDSSVRAAAVDHKFHQTRVDVHQAAADHAHELAMAEAQAPAPGTATPAPTGPFPEATAAPPASPDVVSPSSPGTGTPAVPEAAGAGPSGPPSQTIPTGL
jgi:chaperonin GroES